MEEPNLSFIKEIAGDDLMFQNSILDIIRKEFPEEVTLFKDNFAQKKWVDASLNVHKIKHKISLLGMPKNLELASDFEKNLKEGNIELHKTFLEILNKIHVYLYN